jgi:hypothetical protein
LFVTSRPGHTCEWATTVVIIVVYEALDRGDSVANSFPDFSASSNRTSATGKNAFKPQKCMSGINIFCLLSPTIISTPSEHDYSGRIGEYL